jgi:DNA-binding transcriptional regulator YiaG
VRTPGQLPKQPRMSASADGAHTGAVVSIRRHAGYHPDFKGLAAAHIRAARQKLGLDRPGFASYLSERIGWTVASATVGRWEQGATPPADVLLAAAAAESGSLIAPVGTILDPVPHSFPADALNGRWVTSYQFAHGATPQYHADIAHVEAESERQVRIVNHPPEPRTEGRAAPFRNEIEGRLVNRHLVGHWKNTSDARYFGSIHLAVLPGETVMEGYYTGFASDVGVSTDQWKWVRLEPGSFEGVTLSRLVLHEPAAIHELVMNHSQYGPPLTLTDVGEES